MPETTPEPGGVSPSTEDIPIKQAAEWLAGVAALGFAQLKLTWTCPGCHQRVSHDVPRSLDGALIFHNRYSHASGCGTVVWVSDCLFQPSAMTNSQDVMDKLFDSLS